MNGRRSAGARRSESKLKRWVGVKDSATFMPAGLGGLLDMFDSLLLAPALLLPFI